jgi:hypothetical protein
MAITFGKKNAVASFIGEGLGGAANRACSAQAHPERFP